VKLPLVLFMSAVVIPVFFGRIRSAPFWLAVQAAALAWAGVAQHDEWNGHVLAGLIEVVVVRVFIAPQLLRRAIRERSGPNLDLMPSNLFVWTIAIALIVLAFEIGAPAMSDRHALTLGAIGATVAVAMLLLASNDSPPGQLVAVLFMENAIALFETLLPEPWPLPVHAALGAIYLLTVGVGAWLIGRPEQPARTGPEATGDRPAA
jgi:hydrogenase-4 membrane subunit HyfE